MERRQLAELLAAVQRGDCSIDDALARLRGMPFEDLGFARLDHHRALRNGFPEAILGEGKSPGQVIAIAERMAAAGGSVLVTRLAPEVAARLLAALPGFEYHATPRLALRRAGSAAPTGRGTVLVVSAGTADLPVAEEAALSAELMGNRVERVYDVGVAGLHRLLERREQLWEAAVLIVVAGMEGALPSVVGGLVDRPVIAVPTSVGYGTSLGGLAALLGMLNTCAAGERLEWEKRLTWVFRPLAGDPFARAPGRHMVPMACEVNGVDKAGIVARIARTLADHGVNITALKTQSRPGPETGTPMFTMRIEMGVPAELDRRVLRERLERVAADLRVDLVLCDPGPA